MLPPVILNAQAQELSLRIPLWWLVNFLNSYEFPRNFHRNHGVMVFLLPGVPVGPRGRQLVPGRSDPRVPAGLPGSCLAGLPRRPTLGWALAWARLRLRLAWLAFGLIFGLGFRLDFGFLASISAWFRFRFWILDLAWISILIRFWLDLV